MRTQQALVGASRCICTSCCTFRCMCTHGRRTDTRARVPVTRGQRFATLSGTVRQRLLPDRAGNRPAGAPLGARTRTRVSAYVHAPRECSRLRPPTLLLRPPEKCAPRMIHFAASGPRDVMERCRIPLRSRGRVGHGKKFLCVLDDVLERFYGGKGKLSCKRN